MNPYDEIPFIHELSLRNFRQFSGGFNFSCPLCNEGKSPDKRRGYILLAGIRHDHNTYVCHNCLPEGMSLVRFIKEVDPFVYKKYVEFEKKDSFKRVSNGESLRNKKQERINTSAQFEAPKFVYKLSERTFKPARTNSKAVEYARLRRIPESTIDKLKFVERDGLAFSGMLIFPLYYDDERVYGFQGRSIAGKKFHTFMTNPSFKVYGFCDVKKEDDVYVFESIIDSLSIPNSIAMLGADLSEVVSKQLKKKVFVFDNDRTGMEKTQKYLKAGERCFIWPKVLKAKDFNELVKKDVPREKLLLMVQQNIYSGFSGEVEIATRLAVTKQTYIRR